jgi:hypothetical protein
MRKFCIFYKLPLVGSRLLSHQVESGTSLEPFNLTLVEGVVELDLISLTVLVVETKSQGLALLEISKTNDVDLVFGLDLIVIGSVGESQRKHTLLLQVSLVNTSEGLDNDGSTVQETGFKSGVFTGRTFTVVLITNNDPTDTTSFVVTSSSGDGIVLARESVLDTVDFTVLRVDSTDQHVVGDVVQVTTVLEPRTGHGDVIGSTLTLDLDQDRDFLKVLSVPLVEGLKELKAVGVRGDSDIDAGAVRGRSLVGVLTGIVTLGGKFISSRSLELEGLTVFTSQAISERVEGEVTSDSEGSDDFRGSNESVGSRVGIVTASEVTVVGSDDRVLLTLLDVLTIPLTNAGTASVGKDNTTSLGKSVHDTVTFDGSTNLFGTRGDGVLSLSLNSVSSSLFSEGSRASHIFVRRVGAGTDETNTEISGPVVLDDSFLELRDGGGKIRSEGTVDMGFKLVEINLNELIILSTFIRGEVVLEGISEISNGSTLGGNKVVSHAVVVREQGGGGSDFSTHVTDGTHTSGRDRVNTLTGVFNNSTSTTLDSQDTSNLKDDILGGGPARKVSVKLNANDLGALEFPRNVSHNINGISTTDTNGDHTKTTSVRGVRISTDHKTTGESIVLKDDLMDDTGTGLPETNVVLGSGSGQEVVDFLVDIDGTSQILYTTNLSFNQVITVNSGRDGNAGKTSRHELQKSHLSSGVLASNTVRTKLEVRLSTNDFLVLSIIQMTIDDLLRQGERTV